MVFGSNDSKMLKFYTSEMETQKRFSKDLVGSSSPRKQEEYMHQDNYTLKIERGNLTKMMALRNQKLIV